MKIFLVPLITTICTCIPVVLVLRKSFCNLVSFSEIRTQILDLFVIYKFILRIAERTNALNIFVSKSLKNVSDAVIRR